DDGRRRRRGHRRTRGDRPQGCRRLHDAADRELRRARRVRRDTSRLTPRPNSAPAPANTARATVNGVVATCPPGYAPLRTDRREMGRRVAPLRQYLREQPYGVVDATATGAPLRACVSAAWT